MEAAVVRTIGELIQDTRRALDMTLTQLSELSGVPRGTISRIENGEVKRPEFSSVHPLAMTLDIPCETLIAYYVEVEKRSDSLLHILQSTIQQESSIELIRKVATKFLESPNEDSFDLTQKLYQSIDSVDNTSVKLSLYNLIIDYSRSHGIMPYIAKGMYQRYLIERNDFSKLKETYYSGKYILHYADFLPQQERVELYYKLGIHAYNLRLYNDSIAHCKKILTEDAGSNPYRVHALGILRNSYYCLEDYEQTELYALQYKQFDYPYTRENVVLMEALLSAKKGKIEQSIDQLLLFLKSCSNDYVVPATNQLLRLYLQQDNFEGIKNLLSTIKIDPSVINKNNPLICSRYADYLQINGEYYLTIGDYETCINHLLEAALNYSKVNDTVEEKQCLNMVMRIHLEKNVPMHIQTVEKLSSYFTQSVRETEDLA
ncbi:helix-turn-helix domain-containing protein [Paenibacillus thiaminolyticus]|uniref:Helix-turn-helix domain-containing protein n=1 Tax=Paenibacillus thiaminolyticus TaxID=49283 RepID=A0AAP9J2A9_PANTH|nr:helix-turn-helix domain-containing protein [Paenibacillus thiaminolyticus]MCY9537429.1 helix-turn-helix domain-containing protein [Paenibacillus thiaminolyticus]MCY9601116.1 helix-turn-helix domain-containing protein [Paenibacillus thiaminolyticus]MCY9607438.1 helix-turn-helix domain-containing protein [Paenibacillus thiaminolyticus]MCY9613165.1 helix-turn-helix domain-containing protein [Paenibacillus thiaminolyticus]MCY9617580.1 helix-turn-helix domain-containing protein [Paenibacillus th